MKGLGFLDLPLEAKRMIYRYAWVNLRNDERLIVAPDGSSFFFRNNPRFLSGSWKRNPKKGDKEADSGQRACRDLWALCKTCKETHAATLPLVYQDVEFTMELDRDYTTIDLTRFFKTCRIDLVTDLNLNIDLGQGVSRDFAALVVLLTEAESLVKLNFDFTIFQDRKVITNISVSAEMDMLCLCWLGLTSGTISRSTFWTTTPTVWTMTPTSWTTTTIYEVYTIYTTLRAGFQRRKVVA